MNKQEAIDELEKLITKDMLKYTNEMLGNKPTSFLSTSLMMHLKPQFIVIEDEYATLPKASTLEDLDEIFNCYVPFDMPDTIVFELYYDSKKTLKRALKLASKHSKYFAFHYIKHLHGSLLKVNTSAYIQSLMKEVKDITEPFTAVSIAVDRNLNNLALETLHKTSTNFKDLENVIETNGSMSLTEDLQKIASTFKEKRVTKIPKYIRKLRIKPIEHIDEVLEVIADHEQGYGDFGYSLGADKASVIVDLAQTIMHNISISCKGTDVGNLMATSFESTHIDALWFEKLNKSLASQIIEKSNEGYSSWQNISKTKRHIYTSPIRVNEDHKLMLYVSLDVSGSVSTGDLQKILSIFEQYSEDIAKVVVMQHTTNVIQQYELTDEYGDIVEHPEFKNAFATRHGNGGTSHLDVVNRIAKHVKKNNVDPERAIWLSFSDGYSDLEDVCISQSEVLEKLDTYFIRDSKGRDIKLNTIPGINYNIVTP